MYVQYVCICMYVQYVCMYASYNVEIKNTLKSQDYEIFLISKEGMALWLGLGLSAKTSPSRDASTALSKHRMCPLFSNNHPTPKWW